MSRERFYKSLEASFPFSEMYTDTQKYMLIHYVFVASYAMLSKTVMISVFIYVKTKCNVKYYTVQH